MSAGALYRVYYRTVAQKKWALEACFVWRMDAESWIHMEVSTTHPEEYLEYKIMHKGGTVYVT